MSRLVEQYLKSDTTLYNRVVQKSANFEIYPINLNGGKVLIGNYTKTKVIKSIILYFLIGHFIQSLFITSKRSTKMVYSINQLSSSKDYH